MARSVVPLGTTQRSSQTFFLNNHDYLASSTAVAVRSLECPLDIHSCGDRELIANCAVLCLEAQRTWTIKAFTPSEIVRSGTTDLAN